MSDERERIGDVVLGAMRQYASISRALRPGMQQHILRDAVDAILSPRGEGTEAVTAENVRLRAALDAAIKADDALTRAEWAEGELDRIGAWVAKLIGEQPRDQIAPTCIVNLDRLVKMTAAHPAGGEALTPIKMILHCPACGLQHIDEPEADLLHHGGLDPVEPDEDAWANPPHRSHLCHRCGHIWRPADVPTEGVAAIETHGKADSPRAGGEAPSVVTREVLERVEGRASSLERIGATVDASDLRAILAALATLQADGGLGALRPTGSVPTEQAETPVVGPGGWLIKDYADGWFWTGQRIAAVAALTEGHAVFDIQRGAYAAPTDTTGEA